MSRRRGSSADKSEVSVIGERTLSLLRYLSGRFVLLTALRGIAPVCPGKWLFWEARRFHRILRVILKAIRRGVLCPENGSLALNECGQAGHRGY